MTKHTEKIVVNALSLSRAILAIFLPVLFLKVDFSVFIICLICMFITDFLDGRLARNWQVQTIGGSLLDPLGDKLLAVSCTLSLVYEYPSMIVLILAELAICILNIYRTLRGENVSSSFLGKFKTWPLSTTLVLGATSLLWPTMITDVLSMLGLQNVDFLITDEIVSSAILITSGVELATFVSYFGEFLNNKRTHKSEKHKLKSVREILSRLFDEKAFIEDKDKAIIEIISQ